VTEEQQSHRPNSAQPSGRPFFLAANVPVFMNWTTKLAIEIAIRIAPSAEVEIRG
jgi:hypothetical protein